MPPSRRASFLSTFHGILEPSTGPFSIILDPSSRSPIPTRAALSPGVQRYAGLACVALA